MTTPPIPEHPPVDPDAEPPTVGRHNGFDVYPMPAFLSLEVDDVAATTRFWTRALGFAAMYVGPEVDGVPLITHLRRGRYQDVLITPRPPGATGAPAMVPTFAHPDLDALHAAAAAAGGPGRVDPPEPMPWGGRSLRATTPDGHVVVLTEPPAEPPSGTIDEAMEAVRAREAGDG